MPRVDTYGPRRVRTAALPGVRNQNAETFESAGGTKALASAQLGGAIARIGAGRLRPRLPRHEFTPREVIHRLLTLSCPDDDYPTIYLWNLATGAEQYPDIFGPLVAWRGERLLDRRVLSRHNFENGSAAPNVAGAHG